MAEPHYEIGQIVRDKRPNHHDGILFKIIRWGPLTGTDSCWYRCSAMAPYGVIARTLYESDIELVSPLVLLALEAE